MQRPARNNNRHIDVLVQDCGNSSALAMELLQSCTKWSIYRYRTIQYKWSCIQQILQVNETCTMRTATNHKKWTTSSHHLLYTQSITDQLKCAHISWWRHQMESFSALLAICAGNSPASGEIPTQRPVTRNFDVFFDLCLNKLLRKQSWGWWFETSSCPLWRHCNVGSKRSGNCLSRISMVTARGLYY